MKKDFTELPSDVQAQIQAIEALPDDQIDTTDVPEILDWSDARRGVFYRPIKQRRLSDLTQLVQWTPQVGRGIPTGCHL